MQMFVLGQRMHLDSSGIRTFRDSCYHGKPTEYCRLAGIVLKNSLDTKEAATKYHLVQQWVAIDNTFKSQIKSSLSNTLGAAVQEASHTAAQVIAKKASIEISRKECPELVGSLLANMTQQINPHLSNRLHLNLLVMCVRRYPTKILFRMNSVLPLCVDSSVTDPYGIPAMVEIFQFLCSLLNVMENIDIDPRSNLIAYDEDVPLFALGLINPAIELDGDSFGNHPKLLTLIQEELLYNLMHSGLLMSPLILSTVCSIVLNHYHHLRTKLRLQLAEFISCVLLRVSQSKYGAFSNYIF
ncbi:ARF guanine-nucleotide exchange factor GNOM-like [Dorcoceras hygrometricum]|uniref:ARF guanine-nucleotide exchange factor GNOM-like n=1 Tax=Dorcoceras hygrometricum TaxID=472368 RepID=A0A2Z7BYZ6_9LAMI|nr:ARF guanine-nucleotide exchange factor GNOM-like [Dorcoceras hygrometricum]